MTLARRMAAAESSLTPTQRIVTWLEEAHAFGTLEDYDDSFSITPATSTRSTR